MIEKKSIYNRNGLKISLRLNISSERQKLVFLEHGIGARKEYPHMLVLEEMFAENGFNVVNFDATNSLNESDSSGGGLPSQVIIKTLKMLLTGRNHKNFTKSLLH